MDGFESSVKTKGTKTLKGQEKESLMFESSVKTKGTKTLRSEIPCRRCLRAV